MTERSYVKVVVPLPEGDVASAETLWAEAIDANLFELRNIPALAYGLNYGDVVRAEKGEDGRFYVDGVVRRSGHRTVRVAPDNSASDAMVEELKALARDCGVRIESNGTSYLALDIPAKSRAAEIFDFLSGGAQKGLWEYEESGFTKEEP